MEFGQRLRELRIEQGLSQRQLCGDVITRNMLSQIENGAARPSMDTLSYLAARLGKPISFFLEEEGAQNPNLAVMERARDLYAQKDWPQLLSQLQRYRDEDGQFDEERWLLQALCLMELAEESDDKRYARQLLQEAEEAGKRTPYYIAELERRRLLQLAELDEGAALPCDDRTMLLRAQRLLQGEKPELAAAILDCCDDRSDPRWLCLCGEAAYCLQRYADAIAYFAQAEEDFPAQCHSRLEACYLALGDYKMAYEYACKRRDRS